MYLRSILPLIKTHLSGSRRIRICPLVLTEDDVFTAVSPIKRKQENWSQVLLYLCCGGYFATTTCFAMTSMGELDVAQKVFVVFWIYALFTGIVMGSSAILIPQEMAGTLNGLLAYENEQNFPFGHRNKMIVEFGKYVAFAFLISGQILPFIVPMISCLFPSVPPFLGFMLKKTGNPIATLGKVVLHLLEGYLWVWSFNSTAFFVGSYLIPVNIALLAHVNDVAAWSTLGSVQTYQQLRLLEASLNSAVQSLYLPFMLFTAIVVQVMTGFTFLSNYNLLMENPPLLMMPAFYVDCWIILLGFGYIAGKVNLVSGRFVKDMKAAAGKKLTRATATSLQPLKLRFGNNFMEMSTGLVAIDVCNATIVHMMLMRNAGNE